jgi:GT2 family glycosyltransferase
LHAVPSSRSLDGVRTSSTRLAVAIATSGRPAILRQTVSLLAKQSRPPDRILVCPAQESDIDAQSLPPNVEIVECPRGLPRQRNALLRACDDIDFVTFFDDDFFPHERYLTETEDLFRRDIDITMATGDVIADGILGPGLGSSEALAMLEAAKSLDPERVWEVPNGYGCNMTVRMQPVRELGLEFDERLPLYGWLEDVDFSRRLAQAGRIVKSNRLRGVHLGAKGGRTSGFRLGYSQVANPVYLARKGTLDRNRAIKQVTRNLLANLLKSGWPEPWVDHRGRLVGNIQAGIDALRGRLHPERILNF